MKRSTVMIFAGLGCLAPFVIGLLIAGLTVFGLSRSWNDGSPFGSRASDRIGVLREVRGESTLERNGRAMDVDYDADIQSGDRIRVQEGGEANIIWNGYGRTKLDGGTEMTVVEASRPSRGDSLRVRMSVQAGRVWTRLQKLLEVGSEFSVRSSDVVATVRGTSFGIEALDGEVKVKVRESNVAVAKLAAADDRAMASLDAAMKSAVTLQAGSYMLMDEGRGLPKPVAMDEDELNDPFMLAGDEPMDLIEYELKEFSGWLPWIMWAIQYVNEHPETLESEEGFQKLLDQLPRELRAELDQE